MKWLKDLFLLFFPSNCTICGKRLHASGAVLCFICEMKLPGAGFSNSENNPVCQIFWGRVPVVAGISLFRFEKGSVYQTLLHDLKYRGNQRAGIYLGRLLGLLLRESDFGNCDMLVPVPLHPKKLRQRGYNQSDIIARGASEITGIPLNSHLIVRKQYQRSQTTMNRQARFENMATAFAISDPAPDLQKKRILLIDDIITTGATLEACCQVLLNQGDCLLYVASVSYA